MMKSAFLVGVFLGLLIATAPWEWVWAHSVDDLGVKVIHMTDDAYVPNEITINQGERIMFENVGRESRWPASNLHPTHTTYPGSDIRKCGTDEREHSFDACRPMSPGETYEFVFEQSGSWRFHDHLEPQITGTVTVIDSPDYEVKTVASTSSETQGVLSRAVETVTTFFLHRYYSIFTDAREAKLDELSMYTIALSDDSLRYWMKVFGSDLILEDLINDTDGDKYFGCHLEAHLVGRMAHKVHNVSPFDVFDDRCQFGFFHGLLESYLGEEGSADIVERMDVQCGAFASWADQVKCFHGIGHGVMVFNDYDLPRALEQCDQLSDMVWRGYCYGGVFMENALTAIDFDVAGEHESAWVSDDPHFPCNTFADGHRVLQQCYMNQPIILLELFEQDLERVTAACDTMSSVYTAYCYWGVGYFVTAPPARPDIERIISTCRLSDVFEHQRLCVLGAAEMLGYVWGADWRQTGENVCDAFGQTIRDECRTLLHDILTL